MSCFLSEYREIRKEKKSKIKVSQDESIFWYNFFEDLSIKYEVSMDLFIDEHIYTYLNFTVGGRFSIDFMQVRNLISGAENGFWNKVYSGPQLRLIWALLIFSMQ